MEAKIFSYQGICELCKIHYNDIISRKKLSHILEYRKVRFIDPTGTFGYTEFGDFYFDSMGVMLLITNDIKYTPYHRPDQISNTLWSTVPVIFAGVDTKFKDDCWQNIFTGDVVSYKGYTSFVRYLSRTNIPGLAGDNAEILFEQGGDFHKEGTVFSDISKNLFEIFDIHSLYWPMEQFYPYGISKNNVIAKASQSMKFPTFIDGKPEIKKRRRLLYDREYNKPQDIVKEGDILVNFATDYFFDDVFEEMSCEIFDDDFTEFSDNERICITLPEDDWDCEEIKKIINDFALQAHRHPETYYIFCDFAKSLHISQRDYDKYAMVFWDCYEYNLHNVILPSWIRCHLIAIDGIGRD